MRRRDVAKAGAALLGVAAFGAAGHAQGGLSRTVTAVSQREAEAGLREALSLASTLATQRLGKLDGFFADPKARIPLPKRLARVQKNLRPLGLAAPLDELELGLNRAAEAAMPAAKTILLDAVKGLTLNDAFAILRGGEDAATKALRARTEPALITLLKPPMASALESSGAYAAADRLATMPMARAALGDARASLTDFAVTKALDAAFFYIGEEERGLRRDPAKRVSEALRRVFGR